MSLQRILLVARCAALVALCVVGAKLMPTRSIARESQPGTLHGTAALEQLKQTGQYESLQAAMSAARLEVRRAARTPLGRAAWHAPNEAAGYSAYVTETGVSLAVKEANDDQALLNLSLHSIGRGNEMHTVGPGVVSGDKQTITIEREDVREWFINSAEGLEQGFTLSQRPAGGQAAAALRLALRVGTGWRAVADDDGQRISLRGAGDEIIEYGKLIVRDSAGSNIPARLAVADAQIVIEAEDGEATYPLTIDPLFTQQQRLLADDGQAYDLFGYTVALDGNTALVGAPYDEVTHTDQGSVYVFVRTDTGWTLQQKLFAQDGEPGDKFGSAVAISGNTALIGAPEDDEGTNLEFGSAYVFVRSGTVWTQQQKLSPNGGLAGALFGSAVALDGNTALVGAYLQTITPSFFTSGAAYVFVRNGTTWTQQQRLLSNDFQDGDFFGFGVALDGDTALVGAPNHSVSIGGQGAAYIFTRSGTVWTQQPRLTAAQPTAGDQFGFAVALSGDKAVIGAHWRELVGSTPTDSGMVISFKHSATGWAQTSQFTCPNPKASAHFGTSLALEGDTLVVGASLGLNESGADQRSAYVFVDAGEWVFVRQFGPETGTAHNSPDDRFGFAVALDGGTVLVGAYRSDAATTDQGAAYIFELHDGQHIAQPKLTAFDAASNDNFGWSVAVSGNTVAIGSPNDDVGANGDQGSVYVFTRDDTGWAFQQKLTASDGASGDHLGWSMALEGDRLVAGAYGASGKGAVYTFTRSGAAWTQEPKLTDAVTTAGNFGWAVAQNGSTLVVTAQGDESARGSAFVYVRTGATWTFQQKLIANDRTAFDYFGYAVAISGDTVVVGAYQDDIGANQDQGSAYVFTRTGATWAQQQKLFIANGLARDGFGSAVALDVDTLVVGAPTSIDQFFVHRPGAAYVFARNGATWTQVQTLTPADSKPDDSFGAALALSGSTLVVGGWSAVNSTPRSQGRAYVFTRVGNWVQQQQLNPNGRTSDDDFGWSVALSEGTVVVGARRDFPGNLVFQGCAYTFVSPSCPTITLAPDTLPGGEPGIIYSQQLSASNGIGGGTYQYAVSHGMLPPGLTLDASGLLQGVPTTPGMYRFTIAAWSIPSLCSGNREYSIAILSCPTITVGPAALPVGVLGKAYNQTVTAVANGGGTFVFTYALTSGALPPGVSLSANGMLTGTPTQPGIYQFTITASAGGCSGMQMYSMEILQACPTFTVTPPLMPNGNVGTPYHQAITVTGGAAPYSFGITFGSTLPPGLTFIGGVLSGTPTQAGTYGFTTRIRDANGCELLQGFDVTINPPCQSITINPATLPNGTLGMLYNQTLTASVSSFSVNFTVSGGALPPGINLSAAGILSGTPTQTGNFDFTVTVTANGCTGTRSYTLLVNQTGGTSPNNLQFYPLAHPVRLLDTRAGQAGCDAPGAKITGGTSRTQTAAGRTCDGLTIPANAAALVGNATSVQSGGGYFTLYPSDIAKPNSANSNYSANQILNSLFTVRLGANDGAFKIFVSTDTDIVVDITGYYAAPSATGLYFHPLPKPVRLLDTREGQTACFAPGLPLQGDSTMTQLGATTCDNVLIPAGALALTGNATTVSPQANGFLTLYPSNATRPLIASANYQPGVNLNSPFMVGLAPSGQFNIYVASTTDLVVDVTGYYSTQLNDGNGQGLLFNALAAPTRLLDTRTGQTACFTPNAPMTGGASYLQPATGACSNVPATAKAVVGNATAVNEVANGYLTFWPSDANQPFIATSNYRTGIVFNRHFTVGLGADGAFKRYAAATTDLVIDLVGYFAP
ncbi:MAG: putative Ig domain-containing protein [Acidobacteria bacterium]|nr:putative Ig domain-containing protein [Acidobacteriota bacterium]